MLNSCFLSDFAYYVIELEHAAVMHLTLWCIVLVCHQNDVGKNYVCSVYVDGYGGLRENGLCVLRKLYPNCSSSDLLQSIVMSFLDDG